MVSESTSGHVGRASYKDELASKLDTMTIDELAKIRRFTFDGQRIIARVAQVYDGDTMFAVFPYADMLQMFDIRMKGYDSPEMRVPRSNPHRDAIKQAAQEAKKALEDLVLGKKVILQCYKEDKYGRLLADVYTMDGIHVNQWMIDNKFGVPYDGGTKSDVFVF